MTSTEAALRAALEDAEDTLTHHHSLAPHPEDEPTRMFREDGRCKVCTADGGNIFDRIHAALAAPPHGKDAGEDIGRLHAALKEWEAAFQRMSAEAAAHLAQRDALQAELTAENERAYDTEERIKTLQAELAEYRVTRSTGKEWLEQIGALQAENAHLRAALDGTDCTYREGGDTRHCGLGSPCFRCQRDHWHTQCQKVTSDYRTIQARLTTAEGLLREADAALESEGRLELAMRITEFLNTPKDK